MRCLRGTPPGHWWDKTVVQPAVILRGVQLNRHSNSAPDRDGGLRACRSNGREVVGADVNGCCSFSRETVAITPRIARDQGPNPERTVGLLFSEVTF